MTRLMTILFFVCLPGFAMAAANDYEELGWEEMVPQDAVQPRQYSLDELANLDQVMAEEAANAEIVGRQIVPALAGKRVKLPAYVVPLEQDGDRTSEFLLVPYFGACIHVPPPPPNQIVYGVSKAGIKTQLFDAVWAYGTLQIETINSELAEAGYSMKLDKVEPLELE